jgi:small subunit ribosomal protein S12
MATYLQLIKNIRRKKKKKNRVKLLKNCPQKKGICMKLIIMTPKKPNSAKRKVVWIRILSIKKFTYGYIPGIGHNLQKFSHVLFRGGLIRDLPGVHYTLIRGKYDLKGIIARRQGRSKYGSRLWWKVKKKDRLSAYAKYRQKNRQYFNKKFQYSKLYKFKKFGFRNQFKKYFQYLLYKYFTRHNKKKIFV